MWIEFEILLKLISGHCALCDVEESENFSDPLIYHKITSSSQNCICKREENLLTLIAFLAKSYLLNGFYDFGSSCDAGEEREDFLNTWSCHRIWQAWKNLLTLIAFLALKELSKISSQRPSWMGLMVFGKPVSKMKAWK